MITLIRDTKVKQGLKPKDEIHLYMPESAKYLDVLSATLQRQCFIQAITFTNEKIEKAIHFTVDNFGCSITSDKEVDQAQQLEQLKKDLALLPRLFAKH